MPGHRVEAIANEFISRASDEGRPLTNMQLQKLPYIAHGWGLVLLESALIAENPLTYPYGPVYPSLYKALKRYGSGKVADLIHENDGTAADILKGVRGDVVCATLSDNETKLVDAVWRSYKKYTAFQLSQMTHQPDSPWTITTQQLGTYTEISNDIIRNHFANLVQKRQSAN